MLARRSGSRPELGLALAALLVLALAIVVLLGVGTSSHSSSPSPAAAGSTSGFDGAALPPGVRAPAWTLRSPDGRAVSLSDYRGRVLMLTFLSPTTGGASALIAQQIRGALDDLGTSAAPAVAISADPALDRRPRIEAFLAENDLRGRLTYLSGTPAQLRALWRAYHVTPLSVGNARFEAAATVLLIDGRGYERVLFGAEQLTPRALAHDVARLRG